MKKLLILLFLPFIEVLSGWSQPYKVDYEKFPDYKAASKPVILTIQDPEDKLPDHWNNGESKYMPSVFNQSGGSCGSASRIGYMFTYEINCYNRADGKLPQNQYCTHFTWLQESHGSGKAGMARDNGIPNSVVYGGRTYSRFFGAQTWKSIPSDFGWMQGYGRWYQAMQKRIVRTANLPAIGTERGRMLLKHWLWNHCGDKDFPNDGGGVGGVAVASAMTRSRIPSTPENDKIGVARKQYISSWGKSLDHALIIVGYDDRIQFDLDGNGIPGEKDKDEVGAWILVNSWGPYFGNKGFIYCPYKYGTPYGKAKGGYWGPEIYFVRKNYRPLRTFKLKMQYNRRGELMLRAGISANVNAVEPDRVISMSHFRHATKPQNADVPMLGRWADGMHYEPMEFGYDVTDLSEGYDLTKPLKYFFIIDPINDPNGNGKILSASVMDYVSNRTGNETPFFYDSKGVEIQHEGKRTIISVVVNGEPYNAPLNVSLNGAQLTWQSPIVNMYTKQLYAYHVYCNDSLVQTLGVENQSFTVDKKGLYSVSAIYHAKDYPFAESSHSLAVEKILPPSLESSKTNNIYRFNNSGFKVKQLLNKKLQTATIEFWLKPAILKNWNQVIGPGWKKFLFHSTNDRRISVGWDNGAKISTAPNILELGKWNHVAIVVSGHTINLYVNGKAAGSVTRGYSGLGAWGDFVVGRNNRDGLSADMAEFRCWDVAKTQAQIQQAMYAVIGDPIHTPHLLAEVVAENKTLKDATGKYEIEPLNNRVYYATDEDHILTMPDASVDFSAPGQGVVNQALKMKNLSDAANKSFLWEVSDGQQSENKEPTFYFSKPGNYTITLKGTDFNNRVKIISKNIAILELKPVVKFMSVDTTKAGVRIPFVNYTDQLPTCSYEWQVDGKKMASTAQCSYVFEKTGKHKVTLIARNEKGEQSYSKYVYVKAVAPIANFSGLPLTVIKGSAINLHDESLYEPTAFDWYISNRSHRIRLKGRNPIIQLNDPGVYSVQLKVSNSVGQDVKTMRRAIVVCNDSTHLGINFMTGKDCVDFANPINLVKGDCNFTIEWWTNPMTNNIFIGAKNGRFSLYSDKNGALIFQLNNHVFKSADNLITKNEWHHYAFMYKKQQNTNVGQFVVYKDGVRYCAFPEIFQNQIKVNLPDRLIIGYNGAGHFYDGQVDEFRIWNKALSVNELRKYANKELSEEEVRDAEDHDNLALYFPFNEGNGNAQDVSSSKIEGVRTGFGPEGDAWNANFGLHYLDAQPAISNYFRIKSTVGLHPATMFSASKAFCDKNGKMLDNDTTRTVVQVPYSQTDISSIWEIKENGDDSYTLKNVNSGLYLDGYSQIASTMLLSPKPHSFYMDFGGIQDHDKKLTIEDTNISLSDHCCLNDYADKGEKIGLWEYSLSGGNLWMVEPVTDVSLHIGSNRWASVSLPVNVVLPQNLKAYYGDSYDAERGTIYLQEYNSRIVPANTPVLVLGNMGDYSLAITNDSALAINHNLLKGVTLKRVGLQPKEVYGFANIDGKTAFYPSLGTIIPANKIYVPASMMKSVSTLKSVKIEVGRAPVTSIYAPVFKLRGRGKLYDLHGKEVKNPQHGVFVTEHGQKVWIR